MTDLTLSSEQEGDRTVLVVAGEIDMQTAGLLRRHVTDLGVDAGTLVLDLEGVGFVDSSGLGALVGIKKQQEKGGGQLLIGRLSQPVARLFEITNMTHVFARTDA